jgi:hypothetical protein
VPGEINAFDFGDIYRKKRFLSTNPVRESGVSAFKEISIGTAAVLET